MTGTKNGEGTGALQGEAKTVYSTNDPRYLVMTVGSAAADVYKAPTTASPIVGHAPAGLVMDITRELGSWVKVAWPGAPDGVGYVHVSKGTVGPRRAADAPRMRQ